MRVEELVSVIVAGSRTFDDYPLLVRELDALLAPLSRVEIVSGLAAGADTLGWRYAKERNIPVKEFPADWKKYGRSAGMIRNGQMAEYGDVLVAFWDGKSRGTANMIKQAEEHALTVHVIRYKG